MTSPAILVPVKEPSNSKQRLKSILSVEQRAELVRCLTRDVLEYLCELSNSYRTGIITSSEVLSELARSFGVVVIEEAPNCRTLGEVVDRSAGDFLGESNREGLLVFPVDLPHLNVEAIREILEKAENEEILLVPDSQEQGTNVLWRKPWDRIPCQYDGTASFDQHVAVARNEGIEPKIIENERFSFDLDRPQDWYSMLETPAQISQHTRTFVESFLVDLPSSITGCRRS